MENQIIASNEKISDKKATVSKGVVSLRYGGTYTLRCFNGIQQLLVVNSTIGGRGIVKINTTKLPDNGDVWQILPANATTQLGDVIKVGDTVCLYNGFQSWSGGYLKKPNTSHVYTNADTLLYAQVPSSYYKWVIGSSDSPVGTPLEIGVKITLSNGNDYLSSVPNGSGGFNTAFLPAPQPGDNYSNYWESDYNDIPIWDYSGFQNTARAEMLMGYNSESQSYHLLDCMRGVMNIVSVECEPSKAKGYESFYRFKAKIQVTDTSLIDPFFNSPVGLRSAFYNCPFDGSTYQNAIIEPLRSDLIDQACKLKPSWPLGLIQQYFGDGGGVTNYTQKPKIWLSESKADGWTLTKDRLNIPRWKNGISHVKTGDPIIKLLELPTAEDVVKRAKLGVCAPLSNFLEIKTPFIEPAMMRYYTPLSKQKRGLQIMMLGFS